MIVRYSGLNNWLPEQMPKAPTGDKEKKKKKKKKKKLKQNKINQGSGYSAPHYFPSLSS